MKRRSIATEFWPLDYVQHVAALRDDPTGARVGVVDVVQVHADASITYCVAWPDGSQTWHAATVLRAAPIEASSDRPSA